MLRQSSSSRFLTQLVVLERLACKSESFAEDSVKNFVADLLLNLLVLLHDVLEKAIDLDFVVDGNFAETLRLDQIAKILNSP